MARRWMVVVLLCVVGCGGDDAAAPDARLVPDAEPGGPDAEVVDAEVMPDAEVVPDAEPALLAHVLYLNFDGVTLTAGADDARTNTTPLVTGTRVLPAWTHTAIKDQIIAGVTAVLAPYEISVVTTRPAAGDYTMVVLTGPPSSAGQGSTVGGLLSGPCSVNPNGVGLLFDTLDNPHELVRAVISIEGSMYVIPFSNLADDCMCWSAAQCYLSTDTATCTIGGAGTPMDPNALCEADAPYDEAARFLAAFGPHP